MRFFILTLFVMTWTGAAQAAETYNPEGLWLTKNERSAIRIEKCETGLCGYVEWIVDGGMQFDEKNPQESLRGQPMCGLQIMQGLKQNPNNPNEWENGKIYKADDGEVYSAELEMESQDKLEVTGYIGFSFIGKTQKWMRVNPKHFPRCKPAVK